MDLIDWFLIVKVLENLAGNPGFLGQKTPGNLLFKISQDRAIWNFPKKKKKLQHNSLNKLHIKQYEKLKNHSSIEHEN